MAGDESISAGDRLNRFALMMNVFKLEMNSLKTRIHYTLHLIGTSILAIAFSAGLNGIQVDQVNR